MSLVPIVLFVYNRPWHTKQTVEALQKNELANESELFIYSDEAKNEDARKDVDEVRDYINKINGFKKVTIIKREKNWGLANSIIDGVTQIVNQYEKIIVLEDDLVTSPYFLKFMNRCLDFYLNDKQIVSITGFSYTSEFMNFPDSFKDDIYLNIRPMSWSWATWKDRWEKVDWDINNFDEFITNSKKVSEFNQGGNDLTNMLLNQRATLIDSWYIRWAFHSYITKKFTIYPTISLINNIGHDNSGIHSRKRTQTVHDHKELSKKSNFNLIKNPVLDTRIVNNFNKAFSLSLRNVLSLKLKLFFKIDTRMNLHRKVKND